MRRKPALLLALVALPMLAYGGMRQAALRVSVEVPPQVELDASRAPAMVAIDAADVDRGYVDVTANYHVTSNMPQGYWLRFALREGLTRHIVVYGLGSPMPLGPLGGEVLLRPGASRTDALALQFRLHLDPALPPGSYPLPVVVSATP